MKALVFSMLAIAGMVACTSENDPIQEVENAPVEIKMNAGIITTKAPIESETLGTPKSEVTIQLVKAPDAATADWTGISTVVATPKLGTDGTITFTNGQELYYNADATLKSYLIGYAPVATTTNAGKVNWTITGKEDIIVTPQVTGDKVTNKGTALALTFEHLLTQLQIEVKGDAAAISTFGKIKSIQIKTVSNASTLALSSAPTNVLTWGATDQTLDVWKGAEGSESNVLEATLPADFTQIGYSMLAPASNYSLIINTEYLSNRTVDVVIPSGGAVAGSAHKVQLTFSASQISAKATITNWKEGTPATPGTVD